MRQWRWWESLGGNIQIPVGRVEVGGKEGGWQANRSPVVTPAAAAAIHTIHTIYPYYPHYISTLCTLYIHTIHTIYPHYPHYMSTLSTLCQPHHLHAEPCMPENIRIYRPLAWCDTCDAHTADPAYLSSSLFASPYPIMHIALLHAKPLPVPCGRATNMLSACHLPVAPSNPVTRVSDGMGGRLNLIL